MTRIQKILGFINELDANELEIILSEIQKMVNKEKRIKSILNEYIGIGKGIWNMDAQSFVNRERDKDRA